VGGKKVIKSPLQVQYEKMSDLIIGAHLGQKYGNKPYTYHLRMVKDKVYELFRGTLSMEDVLRLQIVALGHDLIEDTSETVNTLLDKGFEPRIVNSINLMSKHASLSYKEYLSRCVSDNLAFYGKVADTYCNLTESMKDGNFKRVRKYGSQLEKLYKLRKQYEEGL
jgi:(p)ppGpp synthase/HD superfamily hydrolase